MKLIKSIVSAINNIIYKIQHIELLRTAHTSCNFEPDKKYGRKFRICRYICFGIMLYYMFPFTWALFEIALGYLFLISSADHLFRAFTDILFPVVSTDWYKWFIPKVMEGIFGNGIYAIRFALAIISFFMFLSITVFRIQKKPIKQECNA